MVGRVCGWSLSAISSNGLFRRERGTTAKLMTNGIGFGTLSVIMLVLDIFQTKVFFQSARVVDPTTTT